MSLLYHTSSSYSSSILSYILLYRCILEKIFWHIWTQIKTTKKNVYLHVLLHLFSLFNIKEHFIIGVALKSNHLHLHTNAVYAACTLSFLMYVLNIKLVSQLMEWVFFWMYLFLQMIYPTIFKNKMLTIYKHFFCNLKNKNNVKCLYS